MKKLLSIFAVILIAISADAQAPFTTYRPYIAPQQSYSLPDLSSFPDPMDDMIRRSEARARAKAQAMEIVSSEIKSVDGFNYFSETYFPLKVKIIQRRNGQTEFYCLGIKKNGAWNACEKQIAPLEAMYKQATNDSQKKMVLELMEHGNYLLVVSDSEVYIIR